MTQNTLEQVRVVRAGRKYEVKKQPFSLFVDSGIECTRDVIVSTSLFYVARGDEITKSGPADDCI